MITLLRTFFVRWFGFNLFHPAMNREGGTPSFQAVGEGLGEPVPYDEYLLEKARTQWQFGDWDSLVKLERETLQHHPDRAKLALLAAAGRLQTGDDSEARQYVRLAQDWGCSKKLIAQILAAGVHNSLGRAAAVRGDQTLALEHFHNAIVTGTPRSDVRLMAQARIREQLQQLGLPALSLENWYENWSGNSYDGHAGTYRRTRIGRG